MSLLTHAASAHGCCWKHQQVWEDWGTLTKKRTAVLRAQICPKQAQKNGKTEKK